MSALTLPRENMDATRAALVSFIVRQLGPLFRGHAPRVDIASWLAPIAADRIARALRPSPEETADALANAILSDSAARDPADAIADIVADEYPTASHALRGRVIDLAQAVRAIAIENDGVVEARQLAARGIGNDEQHRLMAKASHVLAVLNGSAPPRSRDEERCPSNRLVEAGVRASMRFARATHA